MKRTLPIVLLFILIVSLCLASCSKTTPSDNTSKGVGRDPALVESSNVEEPGDDTIDSGDTQAPETKDTETTVPPTDTEDTSSDTTSPVPKNDKIEWTVENGKYVYTIPPRDDSGLAALDEMYSYPKTAYEDQPDDWYFGKTSYDETTGTVTYVWDRYQSTLDSMHKYGGIYRGDETRKVAYLTFDCGYEYGATPIILDTLKEKQCPGIFFLTGYFVRTQHDLIARMLDEGHLVGNHTVNHLRMGNLSVDEFMSELNGLEEMFHEDFPDAPAMHYYRPPSGNCNEWTFKLADMMGYKTVMWSFAYYDYDVNNQPTIEEGLAKTKAALHPGVVYLLHAESMTNANMLGELIDWIRAQGYELLPLCDIDA